MSLVCLVHNRGKGYLLRLVIDVHVEPVVVDSDAVVWVAGGKGDLDGGVEIEGAVFVEIQVVDCGVFQDEFGLCGAEDEEDYEDG